MIPLMLFLNVYNVLPAYYVPKSLPNMSLDLLSRVFMTS